jgi:hypothetical protein
MFGYEELGGTDNHGISCFKNNTLDKMISIVFLPTEKGRQTALRPFSADRYRLVYRGHNDMNL